EADIEIVGGLELRDGAGPAPALQERSPTALRIIAHRRDETHARDHDPVSRSVARFHTPSPRPGLPRRPGLTRPCAPSGNGSRHRPSGAAPPLRPGSPDRTPPRTPSPAPRYPANRLRDLRRTRP